MAKIPLKANPNNKFLIWLQTRLTNLETTFISLKSQVSQNTNDIEQLKKGGGSGATITIDSAFSETSENPVQNKVISKKIKSLDNDILSHTNWSNNRFLGIDNDISTINEKIGDIESILATVVEV